METIENIIKKNLSLLVSKIKKKLTKYLGKGLISYPITQSGPTVHVIKNSSLKSCQGFPEQDRKKCVSYKNIIWKLEHSIKEGIKSIPCLIDGSNSKTWQHI